MGDWGRNGENYQKEVAAGMGKAAHDLDASFVIATGDNFYPYGVQSIQDYHWISSFETIYTAQSLHVKWYPVLGNHDYKGSTQAEIDYSRISRRWRMTDHYYTFVKKINDSVSARLIFIDTPPLVSEYYKGDGYPDIIKQDTAKQMAWLKDILSHSEEKWKIVFGHHPVYSASKTHGDTKDLIKKLKPLFEKYNVQYYFCGHDHDFQLLKEKNGKTSYIVTGTGGEPRPASMDSLSVFSKSVPGFSLVSLYSDSIRICFLDTAGTVVYKTIRSYK